MRASRVQRAPRAQQRTKRASSAKKLICKICIILMLCFTLTGCSSLKALVKANISGLPYWVFRPQFGQDSSKTAFVGQGKATTARQAELFAYSDVLAQISEFIGVELGQEEYRELSVLGTIAKFKLTVNDSTSSFQEGEAVYYVLAVANTQLLEEASTEEAKRRNDISKQVEQLILEGDEYVKDGEDLKGISCYLQSMALSYNQNYINEEYSYFSIFEDVKEALDSISLNLVAKNSNSAECTVRVVRKSTLIPSEVGAAEIKASYRAVDVTGQSYDDSFIYTTDEDGLIVYSPLNFTMVRSGQVVFSLDLDEELKALDGTDTQVVEELKELLQSKAVTFEYNRAYSLGSIAVAVLEHDSSGYVTGNSNTTDYLVSCFKRDEADSQAYYALADQEDDVFYDYIQTKGSCNCLLVCRFGQMDTINSANGIFVTVEGTATLYNTDNTEAGTQSNAGANAGANVGTSSGSSSQSRVLYESGIVYATGSADNYEEATKQAYIKLADVVHALLKDIYV